MTAATKDIKSDEYGVPGEPVPFLLSFPVAAATTIYAGTMVGTDASGNAVPASATSTLKIWGIAKRQVVNTAAAGYGGAGDLSVTVEVGHRYLNNDTTNACTNAQRGSYCYAVDDNVVSSSDVAGTLPLAGVIVGVPSSGQPNYGKVHVAVGQASPNVANPLLANSSTAFRARNVAAAGNVAALTTFTVASNDGVTNVAGDVVVLLEQTTTAQNGPYVVGTVTTGTAPLTRPDWWPTGATLKTGAATIKLGAEGTVFKNATLHAMVAADSFVVGTTDPALYPESVSGTTALIAGTFTISTVPIFSSKSRVMLDRSIANTCTATTGGYHATVAGADGITIGKRGTAAAVVQATVAAGTINASDVSTLHWTIINQA